MTEPGIFAALTLAAQCAGPGSLPCPEAMIIWNGREAYLHVDPKLYLERCERSWARDQYYPAVGYALLFCTHNALPLPDWLSEVVNHAMVIAFKHGGRTSNRRRGGYEPQARALEIHDQRWQAASTYKQLVKTNDEAFERASESLKGTRAQGEPRQVEESYRLIQRRRATGTS